MTLARTLPLAVLALMLPACTEPLETLGPTPSDQGVTFYIHSGFAGTAQSVNADVADLGKVEGPCSHGEEGEKPTWSDCISSLRVVSGWKATLYEDKDFRGRSVTLTADAPNLDALAGPCDGSFNDCVSSLKVSRQ
jgi:hypothetical protein